MNTIIVGYDDTEPSKRALHRGVEFAKTFSSKLIVTSVAPVTTPAGGRSIGADPADTATEHRAELHAAHEYLAGEGVEAEYVEAVGHPAESIVAAAADHGADLIIVGTRELGFMQRMLGASVSDSVARRARCDVMIVH
jgi:nucleotide-binding universal stress UspA family protein